MARVPKTRLRDIARRDDDTDPCALGSHRGQVLSHTHGWCCPRGQAQNLGSASQQLVSFLPRVCTACRPLCLVEVASQPRGVILERLVLCGAQRLPWWRAVLREDVASPVTQAEWPCLPPWDAPVLPPLSLSVHGCSSAP